MAIEIGSPEARAVLVADKKLAQEAGLAEELDRAKAAKASGLKVYRVRADATVVQTVAAKDATEAIDVAMFAGEWEYDDEPARNPFTAILSPGHGLDAWLVTYYERFMKHRGVVSEAP
jgi:hypothetical protein